MKKNLLSALLLLGGMGLAETAAAQTQAFVTWPLRRNNADSTQARIGSVTPGTPIFRNLVLSSGAALPSGSTARAPYSALGQAFGVTPEGTNFSTVIPGGPRRGFYEQFSITATATTRIDSLVFGASVGSSANGSIAVMYSRTNFTTADSTAFGAGKGPTGPLGTNATGSVIGSFGTASPTQPSSAPAVLPQFTALGMKDDFHFPFVTGGSITLNAGQTLTVRLYPRVGSNTAGRYILLHDVTIKSLQAYRPVVFTASRVAVDMNLAAYPNPTQGQLVVPHAVANRASAVKVYNATGAQVATLAAQPGTTETTLNVASLAKGLYLVEYTDGQQRSTARIVKD